MDRKYSKLVAGFAALATSVSVFGLTGPTAFAATSISESGSSLMYPLFTQQWITAYKKVAPSVSINAASTGSGTGIAQAIAGTINIGASDAYLAPAQQKQNPTMVNIPVAVSAQQVMYNIPGLSQSTHLKLTGDVLAQIYQGQIKLWDDAKIASLNKGVKLPHKQIVTIRRSDSSGDTFLFTQFLSDTNSSWANNVAYGTTVSWPALQGSLGAKGNSGIVTALAQNPYSISYVGISWLNNALATKKIGYAALKNRSGNYELPTNATISAAANAMAKSTPKNESVSLVYAPGSTAYPIANYEYAIVNTKQANSTTASAVKNFLNWAVSSSGGNSTKYLAPVHFLPLPSTVVSLSKAQISKIH
ncbi:phosphate ABC transporter substrate-binding protein PstS [Alicyclobacillus dauci]|uniref:Phosphate-binding protein n=1 Tax=Alicyclobacillus dauci TaxID=1475485 RepID=A0ABY6ZAK8_9BACL|nr:phosphate ABC transporter substrate-binding protein PstS [Alicyclobacillus dauci]WAH39291.1 phosphate ABC transporter substrate-binding protein PstS [Alicyclobacillus dauci]